jgi:hypothetical protein
MTLPYTVRAYHGWSDHDPLTIRFASLDDAMARARLLDRADYPLVDLSLDGDGVVASRRLVAHPMDRHFDPRDDFGGAS